MLSGNAGKLLIDKPFSHLLVYLRVDIVVIDGSDHSLVVLRSF
jgi:hypothetical protein